MDKKPFKTTQIDDGTGQGSGPMANSDPYAEKFPVDAVLVPETAPEGTFVGVDPLGEVTVYEAPSLRNTILHNVPSGTDVGALAALLNRDESEHLRERWNEIQGRFVDEPRSAVQQADALVSEVTEKITRMFASEHGSLESQWNQGNDVSTEDLRQALQHYRSFFNRLVV
jgi:hypothetical protein